jgi:hypothetical protein
VSAITIVRATENFNVSPWAQLWDPLSDNSAEFVLKQDIPKLKRLGWHQKPKANSPPLASEERHSVGPPGAIDSPRGHLLSEDSVTSLTSKENPAHKNHDSASVLSDWPNEGARNFLNEGDELSSNRNDPVTPQDLHSGIFNDEMKSIDPMSTESASSPGEDDFDIEQLDAYLEYKKESIPSSSESSGKLANQGNSSPGRLPSGFQIFLEEFPFLLSSEEMRPKAIEPIRNFLFDDHELNVDDHLSHQVDTSTSPPEMPQSASAVFKLGVNTDPQNHSSSPEEIAMESHSSGVHEVHPITQVCDSEGIKRTTGETLEKPSSTYPVQQTEDMPNTKTEEKLPHNSAPEEIAMESNRSGIQVNPVTKVGSSRGIKRKTCGTLENSSSAQPVHPIKDISDTKNEENLPSGHLSVD